MIVCPHCSQRNPESAHTCAACGASLAQATYRACPRCDALNPAENIYCHRCFHLLDESLGDILEGIDTPVQPFTPEEPPERRPLTRLPQATLPPAPAVPAPPHPAAKAPTAAAPAPTPEPEGDADEDPLADLINALPQEPAVSGARHSAPASPPEAPSEAEWRAAELFRQVVAERAPLAESARTVVPLSGRVLDRVGQSLIYVLVLLAALTPFVAGGYTARWVQPRPAVQALAAGVSHLAAERPVLLVFDYGPSYAAEMEPLARALVADLAGRAIPMLVMSSNPAGLGLAQGVLQDVGQSTPGGLAHGANYVVLGYLAGQEAGLRALVGGDLHAAFGDTAPAGGRLADLAASSSVTSLGDLEHAFILSDDAQDIRRWVEQVGTRTELGLHALVTSRVEPAVVPYRESGQLVSLVAGLPGAAEYERATGQEGSASRYVDGLAALAVLLVLLALATNVLRPRARRPRGGAL